MSFDAPVTALVNEYGYAGLFLSSFISSTILPLSSESVVVFLLVSRFNPVLVVLVATVGNYLGSCTTYYIGSVGRGALKRYLKPDDSKLGNAEASFKRYGSPVLFFSWLPVIGDAFVMAAGLMKLDFLRFSLLVFTGKFLRYAALAALVLYFGRLSL
ncbi:MAG TPA: DedA family protein [Candidatus Methanoperedenaceae archaeon]|nr:DedA family protein [Candidatus Methanoperedenaceae archaeon]